MQIHRKDSYWIWLHFSCSYQSRTGVDQPSAIFTLGAQEMNTMNEVIVSSAVRAKCWRPGSISVMENKQVVPQFVLSLQLYGNLLQQGEQVTFQVLPLCNPMYIDESLLHNKLMLSSWDDGPWIRGDWSILPSMIVLKRRIGRFNLHPIR